MVVWYGSGLVRRFLRQEEKCRLRAQSSMPAATQQWSGTCRSDSSRYTNPMSKAEQLQLEVRSLPETVAAQVLEFLTMIKSRPPESGQSSRDVITKVRGSWSGRLSSSDEFAARKADEIRLED